MPFLKIWNDLKLQPGDYSPRKSTTIMSDICLKLTKKTSDAVLVLLLLLTDVTHCSDVPIVDFEQVNTSWD